MLQKLSEHGLLQNRPFWNPTADEKHYAKWAADEKRYAK